MKPRVYHFRATVWCPRCYSDQITGVLVTVFPCQGYSRRRRNEWFTWRDEIKVVGGDLDPNETAVANQHPPSASQQRSTHAPSRRSRWSRNPANISWGQPKVAILTPHDSSTSPTSSRPTRGTDIRCSSVCLVFGWLDWMSSSSSSSLISPVMSLL